jgi:hypothetical protein
LRTRQVLALAALIVALTIVNVHAKGPTVKLSVSGPGLHQPFEIADEDALVSVWMDEYFACSAPKRFLGSPAREPAPNLPRYDVDFYVRVLQGEPRTRVMYRLRYAPDPASGDAYIYLPGPGDPAYELNANTISRSGQDGKWHHADRRWNSAVQRHLSPARLGASTTR